MTFEEAEQVIQAVLKRLEEENPNDSEEDIKQKAIALTKTNKELLRALAVQVEAALEVAEADKADTSIPH